MTTVCIVVLNWNNASDTIACLDSLLLIQPHPTTIICCDNGSTDDSPETLLRWAEARFEAPAALLDRTTRFILLRSDLNLGYAGGNNLAITHALDQGDFDFFWLLNNDTLVEPDALGALLNCAIRDPGDCMVWGSTLVHHDHPGTVQCAGGLRYSPALTITRPLAAGQPRAAVLDRAKTQRIDAATGAALFIRARALSEVGLLNDRLHLYYEELDYAVRLRRQGYILNWCRDSVVRHKGGASTGSRSNRNPRGSYLAHYHENLSTLLFTAEHYPWLLPLAALSRLIMKLAAAVAYQRWHTLPPLIAAYRDFLFHRPRPPRTPPALPLFTGYRQLRAPDNWRPSSTVTG